MLTSEEMDDGYFQVDRQIVNSSVWVGTDSDTKVLWLFLLFSADIRSGIVSHTIPALSRDTGISRGAVEKILDLFCSPDPDSRSSEFEGRRIEYVEEGNKNGGIRVLNYRKYKEKNRSLSTNRVRNFRKRNETDETFQGVSGTKEKKKEKENKKERVNSARDCEKNTTPEEHPLDVVLDEYDEFDSTIMAEIIDSVRRSRKMTPYTPKHADYQRRQDAVEEIIAIAKSERIDPQEVTKVSYGNFVKSKDQWLHNAGYPLGAWSQKVGHYWRPPAPLPEEGLKPKEFERRDVYDRDTKTFEERLKNETTRYNAEQRSGSSVPTGIGDVVKQLKKKQLKNL